MPNLEVVALDAGGLFGLAEFDMLDGDALFVDPDKQLAIHVFRADGTL